MNVLVLWTQGKSEVKGNCKYNCCIQFQNVGNNLGKSTQRVFFNQDRVKYNIYFFTVAMPQILFQRTKSCETNSGKKEEIKSPIDIAIEKARKLAEELNKIKAVLSENIEEEREEKKYEDACRYGLSKEEAKHEYLMSIAKMPSCLQKHCLRRI